MGTQRTTHIHHYPAFIGLTEICRMFCSNDGKWDQRKEKWVQNGWGEDWVLSLGRSQISMHARSLLWRWRCPWCWEDAVTQRIMLNLDAGKAFGINLRDEWRFQQSCSSLVLANLAGTSRSELQRCLIVDSYLRKPKTKSLIVSASSRGRSSGKNMPWMIQLKGKLRSKWGNGSWIVCLFFVFSDKIH